MKSGHFDLRLDALERRRVAGVPSTEMPRDRSV